MVSLEYDGALNFCRGRVSTVKASNLICAAA